VAALSKNIREQVSGYYDEKLQRFGSSPNGVDWKDEESQEKRFFQLIEFLPLDNSSSLLDYGCGYAALLGLLRRRNWTGQYLGFDWSKEMVSAASALYEGDASTFSSLEEDLQPCDYVVASGIFNVKLACSNQAWFSHILETLDKIDSLAVKGFAFNVLTNYSDPEKMRADLYYADPGLLLSFCMQKYSRWVRMLHDYGLYEFTIVVSK
jgi:hypothetical protein